MKEDVIYTQEKREKKALIKRLRGMLDRLERINPQDEMDWQNQALESAIGSLEEYLKSR